MRGRARRIGDRVITLTANRARSGTLMEINTSSDNPDECFVRFDYTSTLVCLSLKNLVCLDKAYDSLAHLPDEERQALSRAGAAAAPAPAPSAPPRPAAEHVQRGEASEAQPLEQPGASSSGSGRPPEPVPTAVHGPRPAATSSSGGGIASSGDHGGLCSPSAPSVISLDSDEDSRQPARRRRRLKRARAASSSDESGPTPFPEENPSARALEAAAAAVHAEIEQALRRASEAERGAEEAKVAASRAQAAAAEAQREAAAVRAEMTAQRERAERVEARAEQEEARAERAESRAERAEARAEQATARAAALEARAAALEARQADSAPVRPAVLAGLSVPELQRVQQRLMEGLAAVSHALTEARVAEATQELQDTRCVVCMDLRRSVLVLPCKHLTLCDACFDGHVERQRAAGSVPTCPSCRAPMDLERCVKGAFLSS
eukprot:tig00020572_g11557.t1